MASKNRPLWISFNGEIYNFRELRRELEADNCVFRTRTDTEVVLQAYEQWGVESFRRLRGMFAFALWDEETKQLLLVRDPLGIKPLYVCSSNKTLVFASELRTILKSGVPSHTLSHPGVASYLRYGSVQAPHTIVEGIRSLLPGECLRVSLREGTLESSSVSSYNIWGAVLNQPVPKSRAEAVARLRDLLLDSVRSHLVSDVPVGVFLSGGVDSRSIVALLSRLSPQRPLTFTVDFAEEGFSEGAKARALAKRFNTEHHEVRMTEADALGAVPSALKAMDQPSIDGINTYVISRAAHESGLKVALSGLGGDELFAGYPSFGRAFQVRKLATVPRSVRQLVAGVGRAVSNHSPQREKFWALLSSDASPDTVYDVSRTLFSEKEVASLLADCRGTVVHPSWGQSNGATPARDPINVVSRLEMEGYMANTLLRDSDVMGMAHGLEIRVPFVDSILVPYVLSLPGEWKLQPGCPKALLIEAVGEAFPEEVSGQTKKGFTLPFSRWLCSSLATHITEQLLKDIASLRVVGLSPQATAHAWRQFSQSSKGEGWSRPWSLYVLAQWCQQNGVVW
jgi:asparagine synthase (glutamine-hydrolysing)